MLSASVIIPTSRNHIALQRCLRALNQSSVTAETVIVHMHEPASRKPHWYRHDYKSISLYHKDTMPLACARNSGAEKAKGDMLIFLDVHSIAHPDMIDSYLRYYQHNRKSLLTGNIQIEGKHDSIVSTWDNMAISSMVFSQLIGGFDEIYRNYGVQGEDIKEHAARYGITQTHIEDAMVRQYDAYPPYHCFDDILLNARRFYHEWGRWPMQDILSRFAQYGYIQWSPYHSNLRVMRHPDIRRHYTIHAA